MPINWLDLAKRLQSIAQAGLTYGTNKYDLERYQMIRDISVEIMKNYSDTPLDKVVSLFANETGYQTPKVDVRGVVFRDSKLLMVREEVDGKWTLPGGWADVCYSPLEIAEKEVWEETGLKVKPVKLLAVFDKLKHDHPPDEYHVYKLFILCEDLGGEIKPGMEILDVKWMDREERLSLSFPRITQEQINIMFECFDNPNKAVMCD